MAQESIDDLINAVMQAESRGKRFTDGKLTTSTKGAQGEMQVMPKTQRDPGFGVRPAQDNSPEEIARVGKDYLKALVKRFGDTDTALVAYNWGPGNANKWLASGADPAKLPKETQSYIAKVNSNLGTLTAQTPPATTPAKPATAQATKPAQRVAETLASPTDHPLLAQLGPNYQAALAISMLADQGEKEGKEEDDESESEKMMKEYMAAPARPVALASADLSYQSPFPAPQSSAPAKNQLQAFKQGGVVHRADGSPDTGEYFQDPMGVPDSGPITADTLAKGKEFKAADALKAVKEVGKGVARNVKAVAQGVSETPYNLVGGVADVGNLALTPFGLGSKEPMLGSEHLKRLALEAGIRQAPPTDPQERGMYMMGELGASLVNPGPIAAKGGKAAEMLAKDFQAYNQALGPAGVAYAVKPRGGTSLTSGSIDKPSISKIDKTIEQWFERTARDAPDAETTKALRDFLDKKGRKYLTTELGTGADPIRTAISSGEISPVGSDVGRFTEYLLHAARTPDAPGHSVAKKDLESLYDRATTLEGRIVGSHDPADADARRRFNDLVRQSETNTRATMAQEGVPQELQNPSIQGIAGNELEASYNASLRNAIGAPQEFPAIAGAVERGQPIYDLGYQGTYMDMFSPKYVAENINAIPPNKLKNMSFADAMIEGSKRMEVSRNYDKAVDLVSKGAAVPKEVVMQYTKPVTETGNGQWVQLTDKMATKMEGKMLHHSVGGYADSSTYGHGGSKGFDAGDAKVWSLRDPKTGLAKVTVEGKKLDNGRTEITQVKGDFNSFPEQYKEDLFKFFDHMGYKAAFPNTREYYRNSPTGDPLENPIYVNWGNEYEAWAKSKAEAPPKKGPPGQLPLGGFAKGGMVERQTSAAQYI